MQSYDRLAQNWAAVERFGEVIAASGMFGSLTRSQGQVIAAHCFITEMPILEYQRRNMLIGNRPGIPYDAMVAAFQEAGGKIRVVEKTADAARLVLIYEGIETPFALTWQEAKQEPFCYGKKGMGEAEILATLRTGNETAIAAIIKAKYASPRSRAVMLWARCVSDAIRTVCPSANFGQYTPEELGDIPDHGAAGSTGGIAAGPQAEAQAKPAAPPVQPPAAFPTFGGVQPSTGQTNTEQPNTTAPAVAAPVAAPQPAAVQTTPLEVASVVANAANLPPGDDSGTSIETDGPATQDQRDRVFSLLAEAQKTDPEIGNKLKNKLAASGIAGGILGLTLSEADHLIATLQNKVIDQFFATDLKGHAAPKA